MTVAQTCLLAGTAAARSRATSPSGATPERAGKKKRRFHTSPSPGTNHGHTTKASYFRAEGSTQLTRASTVSQKSSWRAEAKTRGKLRSERAGERSLEPLEQLQPPYRDDYARPSIEIIALGRPDCPDWRSPRRPLECRRRSPRSLVCPRLDLVSSHTQQDALQDMLTDSGWIAQDSLVCIDLLPPFRLVVACSCPCRSDAGTGCVARSDRPTSSDRASDRRDPCRLVVARCHGFDCREYRDSRRRRQV